MRRARMMIVQILCELLAQLFVSADGTFEKAFLQVAG